MNNTNDLLKERGDRYGSFKTHARLTQDFKRVMSSSPNWYHLSDVHKEGLEMVVHKIARALNGDENYDDNYKDIMGYTQLIINELPKGK
jgi:hypothetical protein